MTADRARLYLWGARQVLRHGRPDLSLGFLGGIGDDLLCTAPIEEWLRRGARRIWFFTRHPELYSHFDRRVRLLPEDGRHLRLAALLGRPLRPLGYSAYDPAGDRDSPPSEHLIAAMCRRAGLSGRIQVRPHLRLRPEERREAGPWSESIAVQSSTLDASVPMPNKQWPAERMQAVVDRLAGSHRLVQIGSPRDPALRGTVDLRGATTLRQTAALLGQARLFLGLAGFLMHLARAVECPAVIVYGGRETPELTGYPGNENLVGRPPCSPCWQRARCDYGHECMNAIPAEAALRGVEAILARPRNPLPFAEASL